MQPGTTAGSVPTISSTSMPEPESTSTSSTKPTIQPSTPRSLTDTSLGWRAPSTTTSSTIPATATTVVEVQIPPEYLAPGRPPPAPVVLPPATQLPGGAWDGHLTGVDMSPPYIPPDVISATSTHCALVQPSATPLWDLWEVTLSVRLAGGRYWLFPGPYEGLAETPDPSSSAGVFIEHVYAQRAAGAPPGTAADVLVTTIHLVSPAGVVELQLPVEHIVTVHCQIG